MDEVISQAERRVEELQVTIPKSVENWVILYSRTPYVTTLPPWGSHRIEATILEDDLMAVHFDPYTCSLPSPFHIKPLDTLHTLPLLTHK